MNPRPVVVIAVSHRDVEQATLWLRWVSFLSNRPEGQWADGRLIIVRTRRVTDEQYWRLCDAATVGRIPREVHLLRDENEDGYPRSASHLFLRTLEFCESAYPDRSILWCEPDCIPIHPRWFHDIAAEYENCGHAFMSQRIPHPGRNTSHCMGNAVYPHDWRQRAPRIVTAVDAPDHPMFGAGRGQPWDVWACAETTADLHESANFQQIFNAAPFSAEKLNLIRPGASLFHRCKNGTLIVELAKARYPEFLGLLPEPTMTFQMLGHPSRLRTLGYPDMPWKSIRRGPGWISTCRPTERAHEAILRCLAGSKGITAL